MSSVASVGHNESVSVHPQSVHIGAEIRGVDLAQPLADETVAEITAALLKWKVVFFRDQHLDHDSHIRFARAFGKPTPGHVVLGNEGTHPEIYSIAKYRAATEGPPGVKRSWTGWHRGGRIRWGWRRRAGRHAATRALALRLPAHLLGPNPQTPAIARMVIFNLPLGVESLIR